MTPWEDEWEQDPETGEWRRKSRELRNLRIAEVSLVSKPAQPGARILLWKSADEGGDEDVPTEQLTDEEALKLEDALNSESWWEALAVSKARGDGKVAAQAIARLIERFKDELPAEFRDAAEKLLARAKNEYGYSEKAAEVEKADDPTSLVGKLPEDLNPAAYARHREAAIRGYSPPTQVEKAAPLPCLAEIEKRTKQVIAKSAGMTVGDAMLQVLTDDPQLAHDYRLEVLGLSR